MPQHGQLRVPGRQRLGVSPVRGRVDAEAQEMEDEAVDDFIR